MSAWREWRKQTFGTPYMVWHDGIDPDHFVSMTAERREEGIALLPEGIAERDWLAAVGARMLELTGLIPVLEASLEGSSGRFCAEAAIAVDVLGGDGNLARNAVLRALSHPSWFSRMDAAIGLRHLPGAGVVETLLKQVAGDPDFLVRHHSAESLLHLGGIEPASIVEHQHVFNDLVAEPNGERDDGVVECHRRASESLRALLGD